MKANDLRIGNWVQFFNLMKPAEYVKVNARFFSMLANGRPESELKDDEELNGYWSGILLTPEVLEKCGFTKDYSGYRLKDPMSLSFSITVDGLFLPSWLDKTLFPYARRSVKYLHELQNLYFTLTGEELIYTP